MQRQPWASQLRNDLRRQGLPTLYIDRLVEELADHAADLCEDQNMEVQEAYNRVGATSELAVAARTEFDRWTFAGRHPVLTFVLGPVILAPVTFVACVLLAFGLVWLVGTGLDFAAPELLSRHSPGSAVEAWCFGCFDLYSRFLPFGLVAWLYCRLGQRRASLRWSVVACLVTAVIAGIIFTRCSMATEGSGGTYVVGLRATPDVGQLLQILPPLAIAGFFLLRSGSLAEGWGRAPVCN
jgi:hypothetical protein